MPRTPPKMLLTREAWATLPPEARLEAGDRRFTYITRLPSPEERARGRGEERILYEVAFVDVPVPGHGLYIPVPMISFRCGRCEARHSVAVEIADDFGARACFCGGTLTRLGPMLLPPDR